MADEPSKQPDDIQGILSDLDNILSGLDDSASAKPAAAAPPPAPKPAEAAPPVEPPKPAPKAEAPKVELPPAEPPKPAPAAAGPELKIELAPREGAITPAKKPEAPKPVEAAKPAEPAPAPKAVEPPPPPKAVEPPPPPKAAEPPPPPPKPVEPPKAAEAPKLAETPKPAGAPAAPLEIPENTPKDQIRRVAYVYTFACADARGALSAFLSQAARTISKKPLFLREVLLLEVAAASDPDAVCDRARAAKAVAVMAVVDGWPAGKADALGDACSRAGLLFRSIAPGDVQKKSTAVDVIVDMMLLPGES